MKIEEKINDTKKMLEKKAARPERKMKICATSIQLFGD